ncbi:MAG: LPS translocon maturation chaperone LptM [Methylohalobius sp.]
MSRNFVFAILLLGLIAVGQLTGCGQKGSLYLPSPEQDQTQEKR